ncbi:hypothetical protein J2X77_000025 [Sphingobacterium sp. 2149]|nr:hypothetical protein [Sphingobacterium sp. 2149]
MINSATSIALAPSYFEKNTAGRNDSKQVKRRPTFSRWQRRLIG